MLLYRVGSSNCAVSVAVNAPDTTKRLMSSPKCRSVEVINNPARPGFEPQGV